MTKIAISPKIAEVSAEWYQQYYPNLNAGATKTLEMFPTLYWKTIFEMKGRFSLDELLIIANVATPEMSGPQLALTIKEKLNLGQMKMALGIDTNNLLEKIRKLTAAQAICLGVWARAFCPDLDMKSWAAPLLEVKNDN